MTQVKIYTELNHEHGLPVYANPGDSGMDIRANAAMTLQPKETKLIPTGIYVGIPDGYEIQVRPRSGLSLKTKLRVANAPGTLDSCFRGEVCIILENTHSSVESHITKGERIAQIVLQEVPKIEWVQVNSKDDLGDTIRGDGGFGSTGTC
jgi:dUTP pyrophosphatase